MARIPKRDAAPAPADPSPATPVEGVADGRRAALLSPRRWPRYVWLLIAIVWLIWISRYVKPFFVPLEPARTLIDFSAGHPLHYQLIVLHGVTGSVAVLAGSLQMWPALRRVRPGVHRWSGRVYVLTSLLCSSALVMLLIYKGAQAKTVMHLWAVGWFVTTVVGLWKARKRRYPEHRIWMAYSVAFGMGVVGTGASVEIAMKVFPDHVNMLILRDVIAWAPWVATLSIAYWWLRRTRERAPLS